MTGRPLSYEKENMNHFCLPFYNVMLPVVCEKNKIILLKNCEQGVNVFRRIQVEASV